MDKTLCLSQIPKSVREMKMSDLQTLYGGDINKAIQAMEAKPDLSSTTIDLLLQVSVDDVKGLDKEKRLEYKKHLKTLLGAMK